MTSERDTGAAGLDRLPVHRKIGYAVGYNGIMMFWTATSLFLFYFYTDVVGLSPSQTGLIFLVALIWDAASDLLMGLVIDKVKTPWGKFRPFVLVGGLAFSLTFAAIFYIPESVDVFMYALAANLVFRTCWTLTYIPYTAMLTRMTTSSDERASIAAYKNVVLALAKLPVSFFTLALVAYFGNGNEASGFQKTMGIYALIAAATFVICFLSIREDVAPTRELSKQSLGQVISCLRKNSQLWVVLGALVFLAPGYGIVLNSVVYFMKYNVGDAESAQYVLSAIPLGAICAAPLWVYVRRKTTVRVACISGVSLGIAGLITLYLIPSPTVSVITGCIFILALGVYSFLVMFLPMTADTVDYGELRSGYRVEAATFGFLSLINKMSAAFGSWGLGMMLTYVGFVPNEVQTEETLSGIKVIFTLVPAGALLVSMLFLGIYRIDAGYHQQILRQLRAGRGAA